MNILNKSCVLIKNGQFNIEKSVISNLKQNEVLVRLRYTGVCSSDIYRAFHNSAYNYPLIMGHEISGEIFQTGSKIKKYKKGDRVVVFPLIPCKKCDQCKIKRFNMCRSYSYYGSRTHGGFSKYLVTQEWNLLKIPKKIKFEDAACIEPMSIATHAIKKINLTKKDINKKILIMGSGFIGLMILEILNVCFNQKNISILDKNKFKLNFAKKFASKNILVQNDEFNITKYKNYFDIIFEASGNKFNFMDTINYSKPGGTIVWLGNITSDLKLEKNLVSAILRKELKILGSWNADFDSSKNNKKFFNDWEQSFKYMKSGVKPSNYISKNITINQIPSNLKNLYNHKIGKKKFNVIKLMVENI